MNRTSLSLVACALPFVLGLAACSAGQVETDDTEVAESEVSTPLVVGSAPGDVKTKKVVVSGQERKSIPSTYNFACGASGHYSSTTTSNVAWVELKNPTAKTASLSLRLDGLPTTYPDLFVYASRTGAPSSCMTFSTTRKLAEGSSVVVGADESVFVLVASGTSTGVYTLSVTTETVGAAGDSSLTIDPSEGGVAATDVFVSGGERKTVPSTYNFQCGSSGYYSSTQTSNVAWVELKNPTAEAVSLSVRLDGLPTTYPDLFVYASRTGASSNCMTFSTTRKLTADSSVVVGANESVFVLVSAGSSTGVYTLAATTDTVALPPGESVLTIASSEGGVASTKVSVSGQKRQKVPSTYNFSCGSSGYYSSTETSNVAWVELKNPTSKAASLSVTLDGLPATYPSLFVYASRNGGSMRNCMTFSPTRELSGGSGVIVEPDASVFVLVAADDASGVYTVSATTDMLVEP